MDGSFRRLLLIRPRGFCAGVVRAVDAVWIALERFGPPIYVRHEIVHNEHVLRELETAGAVFVDDLDDVPPGARVFFSAHGVSPAVRDEARRRGLVPIDATCPLVSKVHQQAIRLDRQGFTILLIGHGGHVEVAGTRGEAPRSTIVISTVEQAESVEVPDEERVGYLTQTTLSMADVADIVSTLRRRFPALKEPASQDICYATENRQAAVQAVAGRCDVILVVGSRSSSNSASLVETARRAGVRSALVPEPTAVPWGDLADANTVGLTSGASTPETLFESVAERLVSGGFALTEDVEIVRETVTFALPPGLGQQGREAGPDVAST